MENYEEYERICDEADKLSIIEGNFAAANALCLPLAEKGYARAQTFIGFSYAHGEGVEQNWDTAVMWYKKAAKQGYLTAMCLLGQAYEKGNGVEANPDRAATWYRNAAEGGDGVAAIQLAHMIEESVIPGNQEEVFRLYQIGADANLREACYSVGLSYLCGVGTAKDTEKGLHWIQKAADKGYEDAIQMCAVIEQIGAEAAAEGILGACAESAAETEPEPAPAPERPAWENLVHEAEELWNRNDRVKATFTYEKALNAGWRGWKDAKLARERGDYLEFAENLNFKYPEHCASIWYRLGADLGDAECQRLMGLRYLSGGTDGAVWGFLGNQKIALHYLRAAAGQGNAEAQFDLGMLLMGNALAFEEVFRSKRVAGYISAYASTKVLFGGQDPREELLRLKSDLEDTESGLLWLYAAVLQGHPKANSLPGDIKRDMPALYSQIMRTRVHNMKCGSLFLFDGVPVLIEGVAEYAAVHAGEWSFWKFNDIDLQTGRECEAGLYYNESGFLYKGGIFDKDRILDKGSRYLPQFLRGKQLVGVIEPCDRQVIFRQLAYLYPDEGILYFLDLETYEQVGMSTEVFAQLAGDTDGRIVRALRENDEFEVCLLDGEMAFIRQVKDSEGRG